MLSIRTIYIALFLLIQICASAQSPLSRLSLTETPPENLLSKRSVVLYDYTLQSEELNEMQRSFQKIGIDAIAYFQTDVVLAGKDITAAFAEYFVSRQVSFLVFLEKSESGYQFTTSAFNQKADLFPNGQAGWQLKNKKISDLMTNIWQDAWRSQKKANYLINDLPETDITVDAIRGNRQEFYAVDLKVDNLAVMKFGDEAMDKELESFFLANYPLRYKIVEANSNEQELRSKGFLYVLCFVHTRGIAAKEVLGYDLSKGEKSYASITFPEGQLKLKILRPDQSVYKFYFRHIDNGHIFLGTKWDADIEWLDALRNHVIGFKQEVKIN
jgi:hypothetical protein